METKALAQLGSLSHPHRLKMFRLLVRRFPDEICSGDLARICSFKRNTTSVYLASLLAAGLILQRRDGRSLRYRANMEGAGHLMQYLLTDCCRDRVPLEAPGSAPLMAESHGVTDRKLKVLFLCTRNSALSICAEVILRDIDGARFEPYSAGTAPGDAPNPEMLSLLQRLGHDVHMLTPKDAFRFRSENVHDIDIIITLCDHAAQEDGTAWPGHPVNCHWGHPDPTQFASSANQEPDPFGLVYRMLHDRICKLVELDLQTLSRPEVQRRLDNIGRAHSNEVSS